MDASKKRTRDQMEETDTTTNPEDASSKRRRISSSENGDESKVNDAPTATESSAPSAAPSGFSKFSSGGFQSFASSNSAKEEGRSEPQGFGSQSSAFSSFSWGQSETKKFEFGSPSSKSFDWANKDFTFGTGTWGKPSEDGTDDKDAPTGTPTKPREGEIAGVAADPGDKNDVTQFQAIVKVYRLESIESDGKTSSSGLDAANTTDTPRKTTENPTQANRTTKYVEKGMGEMRVNTFVDPETNRVRARLLCRREKVMTTLLNVPILPQGDDAGQLNEFNKVNDAYIKFSIVEAVEGNDQQLSTYLLKPKDKDLLDEILLNIEAAQQRVADQDEDDEVEGN